MATLDQAQAEHALKHEEKRRLEERVREIPLSYISIGEYGRLVEFHKKGLRKFPSSTHFDEDAVEFWKKKLAAFK